MLKRSMHYYAQVISNSTPQSAPCLFIRFDSQGYLINCPEGTQRFSFEHQIRLAKVKNVIFTRKSWSAIGGLPGVFTVLLYSIGMMLTIGDMGMPEVNLSSSNGSKLSSLVDSMKHFYKGGDTKAMKTHCNSKTNDNIILQDENLVIKAVSLTKSAREAGKSKRKRADSGSKYQSLSDTQSLICIGPRPPGKFDPVVAKSLGVPAGPLFSIAKYD